MKNVFSGLMGKILVSMAGTLLLVLGATTTYNILRIRADMRTVAEEKASGLARFVANTLRRQMNENPEGVEQNVSEMRSLRGIDDLRIVSGPTIVAELGITDATKLPRPGLEEAALRGGAAGLAYEKSGDHESVRTTSSELLRLASQLAGEMLETNEFPLPTQGRVRFYLITPGRVLTVEAPEPNFQNGNAPLSPLYYEGHKVIAAIREHSPQ